ncbi:sensor domain-containing diguanylate cyclase [Catenuloplanes japonicus]|uniref:sensor domain-containing diguanylate cyclase n=1 Tax=Catenuloplanes japonicus TaxID=33876 RepID=UPI000ADC63B9|nr:GGDEF domain-containing protein [Catenuloplanes japonicus]
MPNAGHLDDARAVAIGRAYELVGLAQGQNVDAEIGAAEDEAAAQGWTDVRLLLKWARTMAARETGLDNTDYLQAMVDLAESSGETVLLALALATVAARRRTLKRAVDVSESTAIPLVRAVALLDDGGGPVVHRAAALIEVGVAAQELSFWELAVEYYDHAERVLDSAGDPRLTETILLQRRVLSYNRTEVVLDWASAQAMIGNWDAAVRNAAAAIPGGLAAIDDDWPPSWEMEHRAHLHLLAALAGSAVEIALPPEMFSTGVSVASVVALGEAIRTARAADDADAALLAADLAGQIGWATPQSTRLLCMSIAARLPGVPVAAVTYADELARLRWNARLDQVAGLRDAIAVERQRREHEQLRQQVLVDELTGLANRRGYRAYLNALLVPEAEPREYAVMMVDVDHFKQVNDGFGHDVGDLVLARISEILAAHVRPVDLAARLGGDEFVVVLAGVGPNQPEKRAQEIIDAVREQAWDELAPGLTVSISIGVHRGGAQELPTLLTDADRNLYRAKDSGRGRVAAS